MGSTGTQAPRPRDRILDAATRLFYEKGVHAVGVNPVIREADVAPMTLYRQFGGKDDLVAATVEDWSAQWLGWLGEQLDRAGDDPPARFAALWDALEGWFAAPGFHGSYVDNVARELRAEPDHPAHKAVAAHRRALRQLLEDLAKVAGAHDHTDLAAQLQMIVDGAVDGALAGRRRSVVAAIRPLADAALASVRSNVPA